MSDTAPTERLSSEIALLSTFGAVCEIVAVFCTSLARPPLFLFGIIFTAAVVLTGIAGYFWHQYLQASCV